MSTEVETASTGAQLAGSSARVRVAIGMGSNQGDRAALLHSAARRLAEHPEIEVEAISPLLENSAVGGPAGQPDYFNAALIAVTWLSADELLELLLAVEAEHGRDRSHEVRNGPRTLDLDLLLHGEDTRDEPHLTLPHPRLLERDFVLGPLAQIAPRLRHPITGRTLAEEAHRLAQASLVRPRAGRSESDGALGDTTVLMDAPAVSGSARRGSVS